MGAAVGPKRSKHAPGHTWRPGKTAARPPEVVLPYAMPLVGGRWWDGEADGDGAPQAVGVSLAA
jgi:hypothetical protein